LASGEGHGEVRLSGYFVYRLISPRPTFDHDENDAERAIMGRHGRS